MRDKRRSNHHRKGHRVRVCNILIFIMITVLSCSSFSWAAEPGEGKQIDVIFDNSSGAEITLFFTPDAKGNGMTVENGRITLQNVQEGDVFSYKVAAPSCYTVTTSFTIDTWDLMRQSKRIVIERPHRSGLGYEPTQLHSWGEAVEEALFDKKSLRSVDFGLLDTPAFRASKAANAFTTVSEGTSYLDQLSHSSDKAHLYFLDSGRTWPVALFTDTDLSNAATLEEALALMASDGKLKVLYQAQIHGNEPAAGEGALTVAKSLARDSEGYLSNMDVVIVPYVNQYGAERFVRGGDAGGLNLNRDSLALRSGSMKRLHDLYNQLMPEVFIDGHEFGSISSSIGQTDDGFYFKWQDDIQVTCVNNLNRQADLFDQELKIVKNTLSALRDKGFRTFMYKPSCNNTTSCNYARLRNSYTFLLESNGIGLGKNHFDRRVLSHHEAVSSILKQVSDESQTIQQKVASAREGLVEKGRVYSASNKFVLKHGYSDKNKFSIPRPSFDFSGRYVGSPYKMEACSNTDDALRSRTRPTAYILSKQTAGAQNVKDTLTANGAEYFELKNQTTVPVRQYKGTTTKAQIGEKKDVTFSKGAYVFFMDQEAANIIAASMEPDVNDTTGYNGTFVQSGVLRKTAGWYPIYRYERSDPQQKLQLRITKQPSDVKIKGSSPAKFTVAAKGKRLFYKWYYKTAKGKTWRRCKEASSSKSILRVSSPAKKKGYSYRCVVSNGSIKVTSREAVIKR